MATWGEIIQTVFDSATSAFKVKLVSDSSFQSTSASVTSVDDSNTVQTLLAANTSRKGYKIYNDSTVTLYVKLGTSATTTDYSFQIAPNGFYENVAGGVHTGAITGIWSANASGAAKITELT